MVVSCIDRNIRYYGKLLIERGWPSVGLHTPLVPLDQRGVRPSLFRLIAPIGLAVSGRFFPTSPKFTYLSQQRHHTEIWLAFTAEWA
jgi:hypothetical protein